MNIILVGPLASGKTTIANQLIKEDFLKDQNYFSIEKARRAHSSGTFSGEMFAWANFLESIEKTPGDVNVYEFSGTGRNVWNVSEAIALTKGNGQKWLIVYALADESTLGARLQDKVYDAPCPYQFSNPISSIAFMNNDLKKTLNDSKSWAGAPKLIVRTDQKNVDECVNQIMSTIKKLN